MLAHRIYLLTAFCSFAVGLTSCSRKPAGANSAQASPPPNKSPVAESKPVTDPCSVLTSSEIESVQGQPVQSTVPTTQSVAGFTVLQCYFTTPTQSNSVVVTVTQRAPGGAGGDVRANWEQLFGEADKAEGKGEREREREGEEDKRRPMKIEGIGEEAFWTGSHIGGALYVLKGTTYIRLSVGGPGDMNAKIERSKKLSQFVLDRL